NSEPLLRPIWRPDTRRAGICHARWRERLEGHLELLRCYCNFVRPHRALKFGREIRTLAIQAGLTGKRLTLRQIFCSGIVFLASCEIVLVFVYSETSFSVENAGLGRLRGAGIIIWTIQSFIYVEQTWFSETRYSSTGDE